jgi:hypothetical protein
MFDVGCSMFPSFRNTQLRDMAAARGYTATIADFANRKSSITCPP